MVDTAYHNDNGVILFFSFGMMWYTLVNMLQNLCFDGMIWYTLIIIAQSLCAMVLFA